MGADDLVGQLQAWSYRRQQLGGGAAGAAEALRSVGAVYSSHPTAPLSLLSRHPSLDAGEFTALEERREAVRIPAMRQSIFLVPTDLAPRLFAATRLPLEQHAQRLRYAGLDRDEYQRLKPRVLERVQEPVTADTLGAAVQTEARLMTAVRIMAIEGLVLRLGSSLRTDSLRYVATEAWLGQPLAEADPAEALAWLAAAYLRAFGPARLEDFAWWCGVTRRRAATAVASVRTVDVGGGLLLPVDQESAFASVEPLEPAALDLLPKWDAYTMGYAPDGRRRFVDDQHLRRAYSTARQGTGATSGDGLPLVLWGGRAVATWAHRFEGNHLRVTVTPFVAGALPSLGEEAFAGVGRLLGASSLDLVVEEAGCAC